MRVSIPISFAGGAKTIAKIGAREFIVQNLDNDEEAAHPEPLELFLASIATCAGAYAFSFCSMRGISTDELGLKLVFDEEPDEPKIDKMEFKLSLPPDFPDKYRPEIIQSIDFVQ